MCDVLPENEDGLIESRPADASTGRWAGAGNESRGWTLWAGGCVVGFTAWLDSRASAHAWEFRRVSKRALIPSGS